MKLDKKITSVEGVKYLSRVSYFSEEDKSVTIKDEFSDMPEWLIKAMFPELKPEEYFPMIIMTDMGLNVETVEGGLKGKRCRVGEWILNVPNKGFVVVNDGYVEKTFNIHYPRPESELKVSE